MLEKAGTSPVLRFGIFELNPRTGELRKSGKLIRLPPQPSRLLALLASKPGELVTREEIQRELWGKGTVVDYEQGLNFAVKKVRAALGDSSHSPRYIETLARRGYRFIASVDAAEHSGAFPAAVGAESKNQGKKATRVARPLVLAGMLATISVLVLIALNMTGLRNRLLGTIAEKPIRSLAVLPLTNLSRDSSQAYFANGMTETLTTDLGRIGQLRVISHTSAMHYKATTKTLPQIARELNVDAVIEGSVARSGSRLRINAQLVNARNDRQLWANTYEGRVDDALSLENKVALDIAEHVRIQLSAEERRHLANAPAIDSAAGEEYFRGRYDWDTWTGAALESSIGHFQRATQIDPDYAQAWAGLAGGYDLLGILGYLPRHSARIEARTAAQRALSLDPSLAEAHVFLARVLWPMDWSSSAPPGRARQAWFASEKQLRLAIRLSPNDAIAHQWLGYHLAARGRFDNAIAEMKLARELDPLSPQTQNSLGAVYYWAGRYDEALKQFRAVPDPDANSERRHRRMAWICERKGKPQRAIAELLSAARLANKQVLATSVEQEYRASGYAQARSLFLRGDIAARERQAKDSGHHVASLMIAGDYALLGERDRSLSWLEKAVRDEAPGIEFLKVDNRFVPLLPDPRFQKILRRLGLSP